MALPLGGVEFTSLGLGWGEGVGRESAALRGAIAWRRAGRAWGAERERDEPCGGDSDGDTTDFEREFSSGKDPVRLGRRAMLRGLARAAG